MSRPHRVPLRGDVTASAVAELLGLSLADFEARRFFPNRTPQRANIASKLWIDGACDAIRSYFPN